MNNEKLFNNFPKKRPVLPSRYRKIFKTYYKKNRDGKSGMTAISHIFEKWMHNMVAKDINKKIKKMETLEIGAGSLNHLPFEPQPAHYDIIEPFLWLYEGSSFLFRIRNIYSDISQISTKQKYDRIISIATFEHLCNLPEVIAKSGLLLKDDGQLRAAIPSEGELLWILTCQMTTGLEFRLKYGLDFSVFRRHDHVNNAVEISEILRYFFNEVKSKYFGLNKSLSLYQAFFCSNPNEKRCHDYLKSLQA